MGNDKFLHEVIFNSKLEFMNEMMIAINLQVYQGKASDKCILIEDFKQVLNRRAISGMPSNQPDYDFIISKNYEDVNIR